MDAFRENDADTSFSQGREQADARSTIQAESLRSK
jgi:hypothetical protein